MKEELETANRKVKDLESHLEACQKVQTSKWATHVLSTLGKKEKSRQDELDLHLFVEVVDELQRELLQKDGQIKAKEAVLTSLQNAHQKLKQLFQD
jgi:hypothetical protein